MRKIGIAAVALSAVLSASAGAEDWSTVITQPNVGGQYSYERSLPPGASDQEFFLEGTRDFFASIGGVLPADVPDARIIQATSTVGIRLNSGSGITVSCNSEYNVVRYFEVQTSFGAVGNNSFGVTNTSCPPGVLDGVYRVSLSEFARSDTVNSLASRVSAVEASLATIPSASDLSAINARISSAESDLAALATFIPEAMQEMQKEARAGAAMAASLETVAPAAGSKNRLGFNSANYNGETAFSVSYVRQEGQIDVSAGVAVSGSEAMVKGGIGLSW